MKTRPWHPLRNDTIKKSRAISCTREKVSFLSYKFHTHTCNYIYTYIYIYISRAFFIYEVKYVITHLYFSVDLQSLLHHNNLMIHFIVDSSETYLIFCKILFRVGKYIYNQRDTHTHTYTNTRIPIYIYIYIITSAGYLCLFNHRQVQE
jgi:hypothetical protein